MPWRRKSYEVLPALSVRGPELRRSLRTVTTAWMFGVVWMSCVSGSHIPVFCRMLGFNDFHFGLLAALPFAATIGQLFAAVLVERTGLRKYQFIDCVTLSRALWLVPAVLPFVLPIPSGTAVVVLLVVLGLSWFLNAMGTPAFWTWMGDLIPRRIRGRYMAVRSRLSTLVRVAVVVLVGVLLDAVIDESRPETAAAQPVLLYVICAIFAVAAIFGVTDILLFHRIRELRRTTRDRLPPPAFDFRVGPPRRRSPSGYAGYVLRWLWAPVRQLLLEPLGDRVFRRYVLYGATVAFAMAVGGAFFLLNALENLGFSKLAAQILFMAVGAVTGFLTAKAWGRLIDRWGRRPVLILATFGTCFSALPWFFVTRETPAPQFLLDAVNGVAGWFGQVWLTPADPVGAYLGGLAAILIGSGCWSGVHLAQTGVILSFSDGSGRSKYVAASSVLIGLGGLVGGVVGGGVAWLLAGRSVTLGPFYWRNWHAVFALSVLARISGLLWLIGMPDPGARRVRDLIRVMWSQANAGVASRLFYPLRIFGWQRGGRNNRGPKR